MASTIRLDAPGGSFGPLASYSWHSFRLVGGALVYLAVIMPMPAKLLVIGVFVTYVTLYWVWKKGGRG